MTNFENTHNGLIDSIKKLQTQERYNLERIISLSKNSNDNSETRDEIAKIETILKNNMEVRKNLHNALNALHSKSINYNTDNSGTKAAVEMINSVDRDLDEMKSEIEQLRNTKNNQNRLAHIKQFRKKKTEHIYEIMKFITYCFLGILGVMVLRTLFLPVTIAQYAYIGIMSFCIIKVLYEIYDMAMRDNFYYDRYNWPVDKERLKLDPNDAFVDPDSLNDGKKSCPQN